MITPFQQRVYDALQKIPKGRVTTYANLARAVGCGSARAIGQALKCNPNAPIVPCHRVIRSDLTLGGFQGRTSGPALSHKILLLQSEGVLFQNGRLVEPERIIRF